MIALALLAALQSSEVGARMSAMDPAGVQAQRMRDLSLFLFTVGAIVTVIVASAAFAAAVRRRSRGRDAGIADTPVGEHPAGERRAALWVAGGIATTIVILLVFLVLDFSVGRAMVTMPAGDSALVVHVRAQQWWWDVQYDDPDPSRRLRTANEIHVPVGRPVLLRLTSRDVIHSFWAPNLHGKKDLIPGHEALTWFRADTAGVYRGRCAEYCGLQHARMGFLVVAQPAAEFAAWYEAQLRPASSAADSLRQAGELVFVSRGCVLCHAVRGTPAGGRLGPDLTHVGSRRTLAAGTLPNTRGHLGGWILDPQSVKPGARMPPNQLLPDELHALLAYLEGLR